MKFIFAQKQHNLCKFWTSFYVEFCGKGARRKKGIFSRKFCFLAIDYG